MALAIYEMLWVLDYFKRIITIEKFIQLPMASVLGLEGKRIQNLESREIFQMALAIYEMLWVLDYFKRNITIEK